MKASLHFYTVSIGNRILCLSPSDINYCEAKRYCIHMYMQQQLGNQTANM